MNYIDQSYRTDQRELTEHDLWRIDSKLERKFDRIDKRLTQIDEKWERRYQQLQSERSRAEIRDIFKRFKSDMIKWMFFFWTTLNLAIILAWIAFARP